MGVKEYVEKKKVAFDNYRAKQEQKRIAMQKTKELEAKLKLQAVEAELAEKAVKAEEKYHSLRKQEKYYDTIEKVEKKEAAIRARRPVNNTGVLGFMEKANHHLDKVNSKGGGGFSFGVPKSGGDGFGLNIGVPKSGGDDWGMGSMFGSTPKTRRESSTTKKKGKAQYVAYNQLYKDGKPVGRKYVVDSGSSLSGLKQKVKRDNTRWNKQNKGGMATKSVGYAKRKRRY